jgi:hypothetical protein
LRITKASVRGCIAWSFARLKEERFVTSIMSHIFIVEYKFGKFKASLLTHWHSYINLPSLMGKWLVYVLDSWLLAAQTECYWAYWLAVCNKNVEDSAQ